MIASSRYRVRHVTAYEYGSNVVLSHQLLHLVPRPVQNQQCFEHSIEISPLTYRRRDGLDAFGNPVTRIELEHPHRSLGVTTEMEIRVHSRSPVVAADTHAWERVANDLSYHGFAGGRDALDACRFRHESPYVRVKRMFTEYAADCFPAGRPILACAEALMTKLHCDFEYAPGETTVATPVTDVLRNRRGVCQDFAHLMIACLRSRGLAARYVSGYVRMLQPRDGEFDPITAGSKVIVPEQNQAAEASAGAEAGPVPAPAPLPASASAPESAQGGSAVSQVSDTDEELIGGAASHAWVSVYCPPFGWVDLDPTNDTYVGTDHISVAWGRDFGDVSPLRGVILGGGRHVLSVHVSVERLGE